MPDAPSPFRRFSNMQWYLAHSENRVHLLCACPHDIAPDAFRAVVGRALQLAPQLSWAENLAEDGHRMDGAASPEAVSVYLRQPRPGFSLSEIEADLAEPLTDTGRPAFRARCLAAGAPDARGMRALVAFVATHGVTEGSDVSALLRGRTSEHERRALADPRLSPALRLAMAATLPLLWLGFLVAAHLSRTPLHQFRFVRMSLDRAGVVAAARRLGVTQRAFLFGLVAHVVLHDPRRASVTLCRAASGRIALMPIRQFAMPSPSDWPRRLPLKMMTCGMSFTPAVAMTSLSAGSSSAWSPAVETLRHAGSGHIDDLKISGPCLLPSEHVDHLDTVIADVFQAIIVRLRILGSRKEGPVRRTVKHLCHIHL